MSKTVASGIYDAVIVIGKDDNGSHEKFVKQLKDLQDNGYNILVIGDGKSEIDPEEVKKKLEGHVNHTTRLEMFAHGIDKSAPHELDLFGIYKKSTLGDNFITLKSGGWSPNLRTTAGATAFFADLGIESINCSACGCSSMLTQDKGVNQSKANTLVTTYSNQGEVSWIHLNIQRVLDDLKTHVGIVNGEQFKKDTPDHQREYLKDQHKKNVAKNAYQGISFAKSDGHGTEVGRQKDNQYKPISYNLNQDTVVYSIDGCRQRFNVIMRNVSSIMNPGATQKLPHVTDAELKEYMARSLYFLALSDKQAFQKEMASIAGKTDAEKVFFSDLLHTKIDTGDGASPLWASLMADKMFSSEVIKTGCLGLSQHQTTVDIEKYKNLTPLTYTMFFNGDESQRHTHTKELLKHAIPNTWITATSTVPAVDNTMHTGTPVKLSNIFHNQMREFIPTLEAAQIKAENDTKKIASVQADAFVQTLDDSVRNKLFHPNSTEINKSLAEILSEVSRPGKEQPYVSTSLEISVVTDEHGAKSIDLNDLCSQLKAKGGGVATIPLIDSKTGEFKEPPPTMRIEVNKEGKIVNMFPYKLAEFREQEKKKVDDLKHVGFDTTTNKPTVNYGGGTLALPISADNFNQIRSNIINTATAIVSKRIALDVKQESGVKHRIYESMGTSHKVSLKEMRKEAEKRGGVMK